METCNLLFTNWYVDVNGLTQVTDLDIDRAA